jgi:DNA-directed RNA polymerase specialized sigma24 family protein
VFRSNKPKIADFRADYANHTDFCDLFRADTKRLYVLAFLLTANHAESEQCFVATVEQAFKEQTVFKEWVRSWVRRRLIENAIEIVPPVSAQNGQKRDLWSAGQPETQRECEIDTVTKLDAFERFVFVMSILERLSNWDCALLLACSMNKVAQARMKALRRLPDLAGLIPRGDGLPSLRLRAPIGARGR